MVDKTIEGVVHVNVCDGEIVIVGIVLFNVTFTIFELTLDAQPFIVFVTITL